VKCHPLSKHSSVERMKEAKLKIKDLSHEREE
jgi:hypothetical protein